MKATREPIALILEFNWMMKLGGDDSSALLQVGGQGNPYNFAEAAKPKEEPITLGAAYASRRGQVDEGLCA
jgi:hypothetical protein